jgi:hypothetical protein
MGILCCIFRGIPFGILGVEDGLQALGVGAARFAFNRGVDGRIAAIFLVGGQISVVVTVEGVSRSIQVTGLVQIARAFFKWRTSVIRPAIGGRLALLIDTFPAAPTTAAPAAPATPATWSALATFSYQFRALPWTAVFLPRPIDHGAACRRGVHRKITRLRRRLISRLIHWRAHRRPTLLLPWWRSAAMFPIV